MENGDQISIFSPHANFGFSVRLIVRLLAFRGVQTCQSANHVRVSTNQGAQIVGLLLYGRPQKEPSIYRNSQVLESFAARALSN